MSVLLIAEHNNKEIRPYLNAATAASRWRCACCYYRSRLRRCSKSVIRITSNKKSYTSRSSSLWKLCCWKFCFVIVLSMIIHIVCSANTFALMPRIVAALDIANKYIQKLFLPILFKTYWKLLQLSKVRMQKNVLQ